MKKEAMSENQTMQSTTKMISVRMDADDAAALAALAAEHGETISSIIRLATKTSLEKYLGKVRYIDKNQGIRINNNIVSLGNALVSLRDELRKIGVNLNQTVRAINTGKVKVIDSNINIPSIKDFERIMNRMDESIKKAGELYVFSD